jgi:Mrp family chromosome partitioning ATPase
MRDLREDLEELYRALSATPASEGGGRIVMFMSARPGEGASSVAASFALLAAEKARRAVWLIDLDLRRNAAFNAFAVGPFAAKFGGVSPPYSALLNTQPFYAIEGEEAGEPPSGPAGAFTVHRVGESRLMVTQFDGRRVRPGRALKIRTAKDYWTAVRGATDWAIVDAPSLERAGAGLAVAAEMDRTVLIVRADSTPPADVEALRAEIERHGGAVAGCVLNRVKSDARFFDKLAG